jgi:hypothetical protein
LPEEQRLAFQAEMTPSQLEELNWDWEFWARPNQLIPKGDWLTWLLLAGRGFGKTRSAAEAVRALVCGATPLTAGKHPGRSLDPGSYRWTRAPRELPQMSRVVVAIDPSGTRGPGRASAPDGRRGKRSCFNRDAWRVLPSIATACAGYPGKPQDHAAAAQRLRIEALSERGSRASRGRFWRFKGHVAFW